MPAWHLNRRHFLRGAGVTLALPLLDCMQPLMAAEGTARQQVKRSVFIYLPNGVNTSEYQMATAGADYQLSKPLAALEKHKSVITPISGMHHPHGLGHHHNCRRIWLTGGKLGQTDRNSISIDQLMAQVTAVHTRFSSLELSNQGGSLAWTADGIQLPALFSPGVVFRELFEDPKGGITSQRQSLRRRGSILDAVLGEARSLETELGSKDRGRLEQYLTSVREVEIRTERADKWLDTARPKIEPSIQSKLNREISLQMLGDYLRTMYDLIALAFHTDMTRVVTFNTGEEGQGPAVPEIGVKQDRHSLSHHNGNPDRMKELAQSDTFNITQFAYLLDRLAATPDGDGTLLDTTMILYGSGMAYGHSHGNASLPLILAGGAKLGIKHGKHVDFNLTKEFQGYEKTPGVYHKPVNEQARLSSLLLTMAQKMDVPTERFADSLGSVSEVI
ncbi:MAG: hypothetical protein JWN70_1596 [Planctomycetaceae bacterium]|nr:hypothetical protein [Planctomycetaceae bacterium]